MQIQAGEKDIDSKLLPAATGCGKFKSDFGILSQRLPS
jgi:hypothetical protein